MRMLMIDVQSRYSLCVPAIRALIGPLIPAQGGLRQTSGWASWPSSVSTFGTISHPGRLRDERRDRDASALRALFRADLL
jgi:hypothetical protein